MASSTPPPGLAIRESPRGHGRALYATKAFGPGALVAAVTPPIMLPQSNAAAETCAYCLSEPVASDKKHPRCTACKSVAYCSRACQAADWKRIHIKECRILRGLPGQLPSICRALVQALLLLGAGAQWIDNLESNAAKTRAAGGLRWFDIQVQARAVAGYVLGGDTPSEQQLSRAAEVLCKLQTNTFDRTSFASTTTGLFVDPTLSMANHSCVPNAGVQCIKRRAYLRAEAAIEEGDEVTISYIDYTNPRGARRKLLAAYHFECDCLRCDENLTTYDVCKQSSLIHLNKGTLADPTALRNHPSPGPAVRRLANDAYARYMRLQTSYCSDDEGSGTEPHPGAADMQPLLGRCKTLMRDGFWALKPVSKLVNSGATGFYRQDKPDVALALICLEAIECLPYQYPDPFHTARIKNLSSLTRLLTESSAPATTTTASGTAVDGAQAELAKFVAGIDRVVMCRMLLILLLRYCTPEGQAGEWKDISEARTSLHEIEVNQTWRNERRDAGERILLWKRDPLDDANAAWFEVAVLQPARKLAELGARAMMEYEIFYVVPKDPSADAFGPDDLGDD